MRTYSKALSTAFLIVAGLCVMPASADETVTVRSGKEEVIHSFFVYGEGCASSGGQRMSIRTPPANGVARVARIPIKIPAGRACAGQTVKVSAVFYRSRPGFRGTDRVGIDAYMDTYSNGIGETYLGTTITVQVK
jgi:hypothetical protein